MTTSTQIAENIFGRSFSLRNERREDTSKMTYTQIDVDFDVWKAITTRRTSAQMTENDVLRGLLGLIEGTKNETPKAATEAPTKMWETKGVQFPVGTEFRATYKGREYRATIIESGIDYDGSTYKSVSGAAHAVTGNQVNGWRFWECRRPAHTKWILIDELFKKAHKIS